ncbi:hypothetical protein PGT21_002464 [Puccinia graminis f. sp. tritici]|uniref:Uncharacterized protein n=1 Tax=Puccinia graminis f. sp. tritici TaxID=56615 RepID=A0A5B0MJZ4_PUCGR|nr:hypothetical protein PGT21_002464 [Puccinia graminis f. sp. tritici]
MNHDLPSTGLKDFPQVDSQIISSWGSTFTHISLAVQSGLEPPAKLCIHRDAKSAAAHQKQPLPVHGWKDIEVLAIGIKVSMLGEGFNCICYSARRPENSTQAVLVPENMANDSASLFHCAYNCLVAVERTEGHSNHDIIAFLGSVY